MNNKNTHFDQSFFDLLWVFFRVEISATYLWNGSKQASAVDLWERLEEKFLSIGKWGQSKRWVASHFATFSHFKRTSRGPVHLDIHLH